MLDPRSTAPDAPPPRAHRPAALHGSDWLGFLRRWRDKLSRGTVECSGGCNPEAPTRHAEVVGSPERVEPRDTPSLGRGIPPSTRESDAVPLVQCGDFLEDTGVDGF